MDYRQQKRVVVRGDIILKNTGGYLSAQDYGQVIMQPIMLVIWACLGGVWMYLLLKHRSLVVPIHYMIAILAAASMYEHLMNSIYFGLYNSYNIDSTALIAMSYVTLIIRAAMARLLILVTALGYHIMESSVDKYVQNIALMGFFYVISLGIELLVTKYIAKEYSLSPTVTFIAEIPHMACDLILCLWIVMAFRRTILVLNRQKEGKKSFILIQLFISYVVAMFIFICLRVALLGVKKDLDKNWSVPLGLEGGFAATYVLGMLIIMIILRPQNKDIRETFSFFEELANDEETEIAEDIESPFEKRGSPIKRKQAGDRQVEMAELPSLEEEVKIEEHPVSAIASDPVETDE